MLRNYECLAKIVKNNYFRKKGDPKQKATEHLINVKSHIAFHLCEKSTAGKSREIGPQTGFVIV